ncbi:MAG: PilZ domain-containing protein [Polyangiaceae bacterium]
MRRAVRLLRPWPCEVVRESDFKRVGTSLVDLSASGMRFLTREPIMTGEEFVLTFACPRGKRYVDAEAVAVRIAHGRRDDDLVEREHGFRSVGVEFAKLDDMSRRALRALLERWRSFASHGAPAQRGALRSRVSYA